LRGCGGCGGCGDGLAVRPNFREIVIRRLENLYSMLGGNDKENLAWDSNGCPSGYRIYDIAGPSAYVTALPYGRRK